MNKPIPAPTAKTKDWGIMRASHCRRPSSDKMKKSQLPAISVPANFDTRLNKTHPSRKTAANASLYVMMPVPWNLYYVAEIRVSSNDKSALIKVCGPAVTYPTTE